MQNQQAAFSNLRTRQMTSSTESDSYILEFDFWKAKLFAKPTVQSLHKLCSPEDFSIQC